MRRSSSPGATGRLGVVLQAASIAGTVGCDVALRARFEVVTTGGAPIAGALARRPLRDGDIAAFTDPRGCVGLTGVYQFYEPVTVTADGYLPVKVRVPKNAGACFVVRLAPEGSGERSRYDRVSLEDCACDRGEGTPPALHARFVFRDGAGAAIPGVEARRGDRPDDAWGKLSDPYGCLAISWAVASTLDEVPLDLEKPGFRPVRVDVPVLEDRCYAVTLARDDAIRDGTVAPLSDDACACAAP